MVGLMLEQVHRTIKLLLFLEIILCRI